MNWSRPTDSGSTENARLENRKLFKILFKLLYLRFSPLQIRTCVFRTCIFHPCEMRCFVLAFSVLAFSVAPVSWLVSDLACWQEVHEPDIASNHSKFCISRLSQSGGQLGWQTLSHLHNAMAVYAMALCPCLFGLSAFAVELFVGRLVPSVL